jgi:anti-anti-sigma factor
MKELPSADINLRVNGSHTIVSITGEVNLYSVSQIRKDITKIVDSGVRSLVIDMVHLTYMDSSGIALMANLQKKLKSMNGKFFIINMSDEIKSVLKLAGLDKFFIILNSENDLPN